MSSPPSLPVPPNGSAAAGHAAAGGVFRHLVSAAIFSYTASIALLFLAMELMGERWWPLAVLLYLPQRLFLLPLLVLIPAAFLAEVSIGAFSLLGASVIIFLWHVPFFPGMGGRAGGRDLKLITNNYSQNHRLSLQPFIDAKDPDFVALEDAAGQGPVFHRLYPQRIVQAQGQFVLMSKYPIKSAVPLDQPRWRGAPVAEVFDVAWQGEDLAIYAIHLPTPRGDFAKLAGLGLLKELAGRNKRASDGLSFEGAMSARVQLVKDLTAVLDAEKRPFVAVGDLNMPPDGYLHRVLVPSLTDCFEQAGAGFGFSFPCDTNNPLTLGGPWLRLDYILAGPGWHTVECRVEPARRSKHRAVFASICRD